MSNNLTQNTFSPVTGVQLARLGASHGYRFNGGDSVSLNAMFTVVNSAAHDRNWSLQLWACASAPASAANLNGHLITEAALPPIGEVADEQESFEVTAFACPPAGSGSHTMVLALVSKQADGRTEIQDFAVYARAEQFSQPQLNGAVGFNVENDRVRINIEKIVNPRSIDNLSGTLSLELWALPKAYQSGNFTGTSLAGVVLGSLAGQAEWGTLSFDLPLTRPANGTWHFAVLLREWTAAQYVTRDYVNFATPVVYAPAPVAKPVVAPAVVAPVAAVKPVVKESPKAEAASVAKAAAKVEAPAKKAGKVEPKGISVNSASAAELAEIKGLPSKVAEGIVKKRPFSSLDELTKVKGMGEKLLAKLRSRLRL